MIFLSEPEAFSYSVSNTLKAPARAIDCYSQILKRNYKPALDDEGNRIIDRIIANAKVINQLIEDLLTFSSIGREELRYEIINMKLLAESCVEELLQNNVAIKYKVQIQSLHSCKGDFKMIRQVWINLLSNAFKYCSKEKEPEIEIGFKEERQMKVYFVQDNGVGFDMEYAHKLFVVFERLHSRDEFEGTGIGLALVERIINMHEGNIWAEGSPGKGATFYFRLSASVMDST